MAPPWTSLGSRRRDRRYLHTVSEATPQGDFAARAASDWERIAEAVRAVEGDEWPRDRAELGISPRDGSPFWRVDGATYVVSDDQPSLVVEIRERHVRFLTPEGVRKELDLVDPRLN